MCLCFGSHVLCMPQPSGRCGASAVLRRCLLPRLHRAMAAPPRAKTMRQVPPVDQSPRPAEARASTCDVQCDTCCVTCDAGMWGASGNPPPTPGRARGRMTAAHLWVDAMRCARTNSSASAFRAAGCGSRCCSLTARISHAHVTCFIRLRSLKRR